ncbi:MAG: SGNH/GDSL hydrolase family protein [Solobacterium sp.]|nr:SGNH/GDSL hydrolase family protein [Solobacterium sp.]
MRGRRKIAVLAAAAAVHAVYTGLKTYIRHEEDKRTEAPGNSAQYDLNHMKERPGTLLRGKTIIFLGSSVTYGAAAEGQSFVELFETVDGVRAVKEAKSGTTLADRLSLPALITFGNGDSYVQRLRKLDKTIQADCLVCQLSTNDATMKLPLGEISSGRELTDFDTKTVTGAMEYIIRYAQKTWNCPVVFYTGSWYESTEYEAMVRRLYELQEKWGIGIIDLYTDKHFNEIDREKYDLYMYDPIHPTKAGYAEWWMPEMERRLIEILAEKQEGES